jgi:predicted DNA-binding transcriptional regulator YafY
MRGENISPAKLADDYGVSKKSVTRCINDIKDFLSENRELVGQTELMYSYANKAYRLILDDFLSDKELFAVAKVIIGARVFTDESLSLIIGKLKRFVSVEDRKKLDGIIRKEMYHYNAVKHDCEDVIDTLWQLINAIINKKEITVSYYKVDRTLSEKRIQPVSIMFSEFYFYLIAYYPGKYDEPRYFRIDRITNIVGHRKGAPAGSVSENDELEHYKRLEQLPAFDEGELRERSQYMFYGKLRRIKFWYTGASVQAILDKLPTAKIVERKRNRYLLEAEVYGDGIKMFLLSQGTWVKVVEPEEFVKEMGDTARAMAGMYTDILK